MTRNEEPDKHNQSGADGESGEPGESGAPEPRGNPVTDHESLEKSKEQLDKISGN